MGDISRNFSMIELTKSQAAIKLGIDNDPSEVERANLHNLVNHILQPLRDTIRRPLIISSGFRSVVLNQQLGGSPNSQHCRGMAADFEAPGIANATLASIIRDRFDFDQLILEKPDKNDGNAGWVHCSYNSGTRNRKDVLWWDGAGYYRDFPNWAD